MRLKVIDYDEVRRDLDTGVPVHFNTNFHTAAEAPGLPVPSEKPTSFARWLPLVLRSRGLPSSAVQVVALSPAQARLAVEASGASVHTGVLNRVYAEELEDEIAVPLSRYSAVTSLDPPSSSPSSSRPSGGLVFPPEGLFMRLSACSPKDGLGRA